ncbi:RANBP2-like and GRIP domain-containing protein 5/6 [Dufourea novaeangliae]|uniref:RANBP2-like and GRIP domain-containing protein 5/6 n=1 Tax=Dufourea novaeangliae TaxID=178035 RepID=A0A154PS25_DUFNO|nr:RANBP2-like and GRIP domain-containing protein 5/6 [Dufourea novaeangliae]
MFRSKKDVDRHVKDIFIKLRNSEEKNLRCYNIAKLYYQVGDYESAKKYVSNYLEVRDKCTGAYKLLGQCLEALGQKEAAFMQYKTSLELEPKQNDLVLKVCELLTDVDVNIDVNRIKYWVERADKKFPHHPIVFQLKEKMLTLEKPSGNNEDLEKLITSELSVRQTDVHLQVKLLKHYIGNHRLEDAYSHAVGIESMHSHRNSVVWYQALCELLIKCKESKDSKWTFWIFYISVLERYAALCLKEQGNITKKPHNITEATQAVFNFDQSLTEFKSTNFSNHPVFVENMLLHMWGQLHFHLACLFLRKAKIGEDSWSEAGRLCAPLFLTALHITPIDPTAVWTMHLKDRFKNQVHVWYREGSYRCSQAGHILQDYARDNTKKLLDKIDKFCTILWRERVYQRIFIGRLYQDGKTTSYFANCSHSNPPLRLCSYNELKRFDEISEEVWPDSLHHQIWLGLRTRPHCSQNKNNEPHPNQTSRVFCELQFSIFNLNQAAPDSLSRLDIDAFLNAAIFCASAVMEEQQLSGFLNPEKLPTLPADLTNTLCTCAQEKWWSAAYKVYSMDKQKPLDDDLGEIRLELQRGLEVVRCIGNHGLHPALLVHLARIFHHRTEMVKESDQENSAITSLEARSEMYWSNAIPLLERLQNNQILRVTNSKYFTYQGKEMNNAELVKALEEGKLLLAQRFVRDKQYEKAIDALQALKCPEASFQQGQMYEMLADEIVSSMPKESLTSEMRSQHIIMLSKARECFYLTLDRLRSPGTNPKHPLNSELSTHITDIENKLKRIDPDLSRGDLSRNECDGMSDDSYSSAHSAVDPPVVNSTLPTFTGLSASIMVSTPQKNPHRTPKQSSTPYKPQHQDVLDLSRNRSEARPSPERLDAQIRAINHMIHAKDSMIQSITEQNKSILELNKTVMEKVEELAKEVTELRKEIQQQRTQSVNLNPNLEDLCVLNEEDYSNLNYNTNPPGPASSISGNMFQSPHRHPYSQLVYPSATAFQGYFPGGMSFSDPNASFCTNIYPMPVLYPNTRSKMPENVLQQGLFPPRLPTQIPDLMPPTNQSLQIRLQKAETSKPETTIKDAPVNKVAPVNVVITTSDTLPTTVPVVQPTLSVTIPPHFRQGSTSMPITTEQIAPHSYQISMPSQATVLTTVNLPPLSTTLTTTPANITMPETPKTDNINICSTNSPRSSDHEHEDEHDPIPNFVPIIPLPAEVKITTGEEGEEVLFCARAKLFRFVDNEWKERGIGNVKLLKNEEGKVRLLMRREQVLKVCANHYLAPDMELTAKANNEKAWFWVAHDFADGELKLEKFSIRFKTVEEGLSFKEQFDKAKVSLSQITENVENRTFTKVGGPLNNMKKKETMSIETKTSGQINQKQAAEIVALSESSERSKISTTTTVVGGFSFKSTPIIQKVVVTEQSKTPSKPEVSPFAGFTFNKTVTTAESVTPKSIATSIGTQAFRKTTPSKLETTTAPTIVTTETAATSISQTALRRPHAPSPNMKARVGIQSTDSKIEQEEVLFEAKISLQYYINDTKQWEHRGTKSGSNNVVNWTIQYGPDKKTGMFAATFKTPAQASQFYNTIVNNQQKLQKDSVPCESTKKQETIQNTQINKSQVPLAEMFKPPTGSWECEDCYARNNASDNECIACKAACPSATSKQSVLSATGSKQAPLSEWFKPPPGSWECPDCYTRNNASNNECLACKAVCPSATNKQSVPSATSSKQVPLSEMFKPPTGSWECEDCYTRNSASNTECLACKAVCPSATNKQCAPVATASNQVPLSEMFKSPTGSWKCKSCDIFNTFGNNYCVACDTPKDPSIPPKQKTGGFLISSSTTGTTPTFTFGIPPDATKKETSGFTFRLPTANDVSSSAKSSAIPESDAKIDTSGTKFVFGMQQTPSTPSNEDTPFTFGSSGKSFGFNFVAKSPAKSPEDGEISEEEVVESDDIYFSPIIPLPDKIEVKTGEENEEILYSHRAKLFRYDKSVNEWKERGLGDIKLLRHTETRKLRLVMRREQILKLCLNHFVLPDLEFKPKDEKTWMWTAADYSEGEIEHTLFACRFKTSDIAKNFMEIVDDARTGKDLPVIEFKTETKSEEPTKSSPVQEIEVLYELKVTPEEREAALKLQLPENFYAYKRNQDCPGCRGCKEPPVPLFEDDTSEKVSSLKTTAASQKPTTNASTIQFSPKTTSSSVTTVQSPVSSTSMQNTGSSVFTTGLYSTGAPQFSMNSLATTTPSTISFGSSDSGASNDKKTGFSFVMSQNHPSEAQNVETDKQDILSPENLKICGLATSEAQTTSETSVPTTSTASIFGKNIFGGSSKKDSPGLIKPSSFSVSANSSESMFPNSFGFEAKTTTTSTTSVTPIFGANTPIFGSSAMKLNSEITTSNSSPFATSTTTASVFDTPAETTNSMFGGASTPFSFNLPFGARTHESPFRISNSATTNVFDTKPTTSESESQKDNGISFLPAVDVSFSALAAKTPQQAFKTADPNFSFAGAGSAVFGSKATNKFTERTKGEITEKKDEHREEECDENENEQDHDPHFEPIVPLPDVIEVRTGEEDEEKVFCERAKLYRYVNATREWKERGVGEMKILHHAGHGTYRLLLRREQVHKVVCNLLLTPDIEFARLSTSDRAWMWAGMNYAEDPPCIEQLAVKFKNPELATKFKDTVDRIQQTLNEIREKNTQDNSVIQEPDEEENDADEVENEDEEEEDDDGETSIVFERRATLLTRTSKDAQWKPVAVGNLIIYYDSVIVGGTIILEMEKTGEVVSNTIISINTQMQVDGTECIWTAIDYALQPATKRTLKAVFSSVQDSEEMYKCFQDVSKNSHTAL